MPPNRPAQLAAKPPESFGARAVKAAYYALIENLDMRLGQILDHLEETGQAEDTMVVFGSEHGEMPGDHGPLYKACRFYDGLVRVPLVFALPGRVRTGVVSRWSSCSTSRRPHRYCGHAQPRNRQSRHHGTPASRCACMSGECVATKPL
ncbi:MAG: hypothetical protein CMH13_17960 [Martelella sp.]|nr:hypothetical protein [Martelella sp.]|tara:strand:+ start:349 stop:795 length:447 start_codon:yes stop_codon:yes gene_type:complete